MRIGVQVSLLAVSAGLVSIELSFAQSSEDPTQLGARQIEVRSLDVSYDTAYRAATQALFSLGYSIVHSDKPSGILTASRTTGTKQMKEDQAARQERQTRTIFGLLPYIGWLAPLLPEKEITQSSGLQITMLIQPQGQNQTQIRFKMQQDGEPVWDQVTIDKLWVTTQREAMIESGPPAEKPAANTQQSSGPEPKVKQRGDDEIGDVTSKQKL